MDIGARVKYLRKALGLTQKELAIKCGYKSLTTINKIELGINNVPLDVIEKLASALQVTPAYLMGWEETTKQENELISLINQFNEEQLKEFINFANYILNKNK